MTRLILPSTLPFESTDQQSHTLFGDIDGDSDDQEQDVDVFISTQVQGRMDEFEEDDDCQQRATSLFAKFKNTANDGDNKRKHTVNRVVQQVSKVKAKNNESRAKTTAKTKTKTKQVRRKRTVPPKSITETMLRKFSGKQGKISQLIRSSSKTSLLESRSKESRAKDGDNQRPMTIQELTRAKYVLTFKPQVTHSQFHQPPLIEDRKSLWHTSSSQPQSFTPQDRYDLTLNQRDENSVVKFRDAMKITKPFSVRKEQYHFKQKESEVEHEQDDGNFHYLTLSQIIGVRSKSVQMDQDQANQEKGSNDDDAFDYTKLPQYHDPSSFDINQFIDDTDDSHFHDDLDEIIPCSEDEGEPLTLKPSSVSCLGRRKKNLFTCGDQVYNDECIECSEDEFGICYR